MRLKRKQRQQTQSVALDQLEKELAEVRRQSESEASSADQTTSSEQPTNSKRASVSKIIDHAIVQTSDLAIVHATKMGAREQSRETEVMSPGNLEVDEDLNLPFETQTSHPTPPPTEEECPNCYQKMMRRSISEGDPTSDEYPTRKLSRSAYVEDLHRNVAETDEPLPEPKLRNSANYSEDGVSYKTAFEEHGVIDVAPTGAQKAKAEEKEKVPELKQVPTSPTAPPRRPGKLPIITKSSSTSSVPAKHKYYDHSPVELTYDYEDVPILPTKNTPLPDIPKETITNDKSEFYEPEIEQLLQPSQNELGIQSVEEEDLPAPDSTSTSENEHSAVKPHLNHYDTAPDETLPESDSSKPLQLDSSSDQEGAYSGDLAGPPTTTSGYASSLWDADQDAHQRCRSQPLLSPNLTQERPFSADSGISVCTNPRCPYSPKFLLQIRIGPDSKEEILSVSSPHPDIDSGIENNRTSPSTSAEFSPRSELHAAPSSGSAKKEAAGSIPYTAAKTKGLVERIETPPPEHAPPPPPFEEREYTEAEKQRARERLDQVLVPIAVKKRQFEESAEREEIRHREEDYEDFPSPPPHISKTSSVESSTRFDCEKDRVESARVDATLHYGNQTDTQRVEQSLREPVNSSSNSSEEKSVLVELTVELNREQTGQVNTRQYKLRTTHEEATHDARAPTTTRSRSASREREAKTMAPPSGSLYKAVDIPFDDSSPAVYKPSTNGKDQREFDGCRTLTLEMGAHPIHKGFGFGVSNQKQLGAPVRVNSVVIGTPADRAGLQVGDHIVSINGESVLEAYPSAISRMIHEAVRLGEAELRIQKTEGTPRSSSVPPPLQKSPSSFDKTRNMFQEVAKESSVNSYAEFRKRSQGSVGNLRQDSQTSLSPASSSSEVYKSGPMRSTTATSSFSELYRTPVQSFKEQSKYDEVLNQDNYATSSLQRGINSQLPPIETGFRKSYGVDMDNQSEDARYRVQTMVDKTGPGKLQDFIPEVERAAAEAQGDTWNSERAQRDYDVLSSRPIEDEPKLIRNYELRTSPAVNKSFALHKEQDNEAVCAVLKRSTLPRNANGRQLDDEVDRDAEDVQDGRGLLTKRAETSRDSERSASPRLVPILKKTRSEPELDRSEPEERTEEEYYRRTYQVERTYLPTDSGFEEYAAIPPRPRSAASSVREIPVAVSGRGVSPYADADMTSYNHGYPREREIPIRLVRSPAESYEYYDGRARSTTSPHIVPVVVARQPLSRHPEPLQNEHHQSIRERRYERSYEFERLGDERPAPYVANESPVRYDASRHVSRSDIDAERHASRTDMDADRYASRSRPRPTTQHGYDQRGYESDTKDVEYEEVDYGEIGNTRDFPVVGSYGNPRYTVVPVERRTGRNPRREMVQPYRNRAKSSDHLYYSGPDYGRQEYYSSPKAYGTDAVSGPSYRFYDREGKQVRRDQSTDRRIDITRSYETLDDQAQQSSSEADPREWRSVIRSQRQPAPGRPINKEKIQETSKSLSNLPVYINKKMREQEEKFLKEQEENQRYLDSARKEVQEQQRYNEQQLIRSAASNSAADRFTRQDYSAPRQTRDFSTERQSNYSREVQEKNYGSSTYAPQNQQYSRTNQGNMSQSSGYGSSSAYQPSGTPDRNLNGYSKTYGAPEKPSRNINGNPPETKKDPVVAVSGKHRCAHCDNELGRGQAMIIESLNLYYHLSCFRCYVCNTPLGNGTKGADVRVRDGRLHCQSCYSNDQVQLSKV